MDKINTKDITGIITINLDYCIVNLRDGRSIPLPYSAGYVQGLCIINFRHGVDICTLGNKDKYNDKK
jgi:hypothetical protein